jgi:hypothetical protein
MGISNGKIVKEEHAVKGLSEELYLRLCRQLTLFRSLREDWAHKNIARYQYGEADIVGSVRALFVKH